VNRQCSSGTRLLFDALLAEAAIAVKQINGYRHEEFTHSAVAAEVAYGSADVGFGTGSAARCYALEFLPLAEEVYSLAWNQFWQDDERLQTFRLAGKESYEGQLIQSKPLTARVFLAQFIDG
jgi:molybdate-binding protein